MTRRQWHRYCALASQFGRLNWGCQAHGEISIRLPSGRIKLVRVCQ